MSNLIWTKQAEDIFDRVIKNLPQFHRSVAKRLVKESAEQITISRGGDDVNMKDLVQAFFQEVPPAFKDMMKRLFKQQNINYLDYIDE